MTNWANFILRGYKFSSALATLVLGAAGGLLGLWIGLPLGVLLGSLISVAVSATFGMRLFGRLPGIPQNWRMLVIPIIGVAIGGSVTPDVLQQMLRWWPSLLAVIVFVPLAHAISYHLYRRLAGLEPVTAFFAAMPGGYVEALEMGEERGADMQMLLMLQFLRLILCIVMIPLVFAAFTGHLVGSGSGVVMRGSDLLMTAPDAMILVGCAVVGYFGAKAVNFPAPILVGPLTLSGLVHAVGWVEASPAPWVIMTAQWVIGTSLGSRFAGLKPAKLWLALRMSLVSITALLGLALIFALILSGAISEPLSAVILAFAPGGVSEMALVAVSLQLSAIYVTVNHLARIVLSVIVARVGLRFLPDPASDKRPDPLP